MDAAAQVLQRVFLGVERKSEWKDGGKKRSGRGSGETRGCGGGRGGGPAPAARRAGEGGGERGEELRPGLRWTGGESDFIRFRPEAEEFLVMVRPAYVLQGGGCSQGGETGAWCGEGEEGSGPLEGGGARSRARGRARDGEVCRRGRVGPGAGGGAGRRGEGGGAGGGRGRALSGSSGVRREARLEQQGPVVLEGGETEEPQSGAIWLNLPEGQAEIKD